MRALRCCPRQQIQPQESFLSACSRSRGGGRMKVQCRQLPALTGAPFPLSVFGPWCSKARKIGAVCFSRLLPSDSWPFPALAPGSFPINGLGPVPPAGCRLPVLPQDSWVAQIGLPRLITTLPDPKPAAKAPRQPRPGFTSPIPNAQTPKQQNTPGAGAATPGMLQRAASQKHELLWQRAG